MKGSLKIVLITAIAAICGIGGFVCWWPAAPNKAAGSQPAVTKSQRSRGRVDLSKGNQTILISGNEGNGLSDADLQRLRNWARKFPQIAAKWLESQPPGKERNQAAEQVTLAWSEVDMEKARKWAMRLADTELQQVVLKVVIGELRRSDPREALRLTASISSEAERDELSSQVIRELVMVDRESAITAAREMKNATQQRRLLADIAVEWSCSDPVSAANLLLESPEFGHMEENAVVSIVQRWSQESPLEAANWVMNFPEPIRSTAAGNLVSIWAQSDPTAVEKWLNECEDNSTKDKAICAYVAVLRSKGMQAAQQWASQIGEFQLRMSVLASLQSSEIPVGRN